MRAGRGRPIGRRRFGDGSCAGNPGRHPPDAGETLRRPADIPSWSEVGSAPRQQRRYRRYRILGVLPALVLVSEGFFLGLAQGDWIVFVAGAAFLLISIGMIATDRPARVDKSEERDAPDATPFP